MTQATRQGLAWGLGHSLTLLLFGGAVLLMETLVPQGMAQLLELAVGVMLVLLGLDVLRRLLRERVHFHRHSHGETVHFHAHSHAGNGSHARDPHRHQHPARVPLRALLVGMMHGMAGSAALIILALQSVSSPLQGFLYLALFGIGSIFGMGLLAAAISLPLRYSARSFTWAHNGLKGGVGIATMALGGVVIYRILFIEGLLGL